MRADFANSRRARIAYEMTGPESRPDVLLLHAGVADRRSWQQVIAELTGSVRCISFDARGYGDTAYEPEDGWSAVSDALAVLDAAGSDRAYVCGSSLGGRTAIDLALAHPDRVAGLVLIAPAVSGAPSMLSDAATDDLVRRIDDAEQAGDEGAATGSRRGCGSTVRRARKAGWAIRCGVSSWR